MINLLEILSKIEDEQEKGLIPLDDWKLIELDHLFDMDFNQSGEYKMVMDKNPVIVVYKKKNMTHTLPDGRNVKGDGYILEDKTKKEIHVFPTFGKLLEFFDEYEQDFKS